MERRFQAVKVPPPNEEDAIKIIMGIKEKYEKFHAVSYTDDAIHVLGVSLAHGIFRTGSCRTRRST